MKAVPYIILLLLLLVVLLRTRRQDGFLSQVGSKCIYDSQCNPMRFCRDTGRRDPDTDIYIHRCSRNSGFLQNPLDYVPNLSDFETEKLN